MLSSLRKPGPITTGFGFAKDDNRFAPVDGSRGMDPGSALGGACHRARVRATRRPRLSGMTPSDTASHSRRALRPSFASTRPLKRQRAQGMPGV